MDGADGERRCVHDMTRIPRAKMWIRGTPSSKVACYLFTALCLTACRRSAPNAEIRLAPAWELANAIPPDADAASTVTKTDVSLKEAEPVDPCAQRGPETGSTCTEAGMICLTGDHPGGELLEVRCDGKIWIESKAARRPTGPAQACPAAPPTSGAPCVGRYDCVYSKCYGVDPMEGEAWLINWTCYQGAWRRYDLYCLGE
jgi:hypothetical protein